MRKVWIIVLLTVLPGFLCQAQEEALTYLKELSDEYEQVVRSQWQYARAVVEGGDYSREKARLLDNIQEAEERIMDIRPYRGERALKDSVLMFLALNRQMVSEDYTRLADLQNLGERTFEELDEFLYAQEKAYRRLGRLAATLRKEEERFASKYGIRLVSRDDRFARRLIEMNELFSYYNSIYLAFYKAYSQELLVFRTIEEQNPIQINSSLELLSAYAGEGIREVKRAGGFKGDKKLYGAALACLEFYKEEADNELKVIAEYYEKLAKLEDLKAARKEGARNADAYNALVREINAAGSHLNAINEKLNKERVEVLHRWNEASSNFLAIQVP